MAKKLLIIGPPGTGKTTGAEELDPQSTFFICPDDKELPFRGWRSKYKTVLNNTGKLDLDTSNLYRGKNPTNIIKLMQAISDNKPEIKVVILDTITSMMTHEFMATAKEKGFEKYTNLALDTYKVLTTIDSLRDDLTVIVLSHAEDSYDSEGILRTKFKTVGGKLIGEKIEPEGLFTVVLYSEVTMENGSPKYSYITQNNGKNSCKSPKGMFEDLKIPNNLKYVLEKIEEYEK